MTDAIAADIKKIFYVMASGPVPQDLALCRGFGILGRCDMVNYRLDFVRGKNPIHIFSYQIVNGYRGGNFMTQDYIYIKYDMCR